MMSNPIGVLLMAHGGPDAPQDIAGYLSHIRSGSVVSSRLTQAFEKQYQRLGGQSPLLGHSQKQMQALQKKLGRDFKVYLGMRYWAPWIADTIDHMKNDGITQAVSCVLAPQFSRLSGLKYLSYIDKGQNLSRSQIDFKHVLNYHHRPLLIKAYAQTIQQALKLAKKTAKAHVLLTAHSLPVETIRQGDPYEFQVRETASLIARKLQCDDDSWSFCFQSKGKRPGAWLEPEIDAVLPQLKAQGFDTVVVCPVCFVSDHSETLFDLDIEAQDQAKAIDLHLIRAPALHQNSNYIRLLAQLVKEQAAYFA